ncbi:hypothetical protein [Actinoplanes sp. GCM10030250]|uniref:effector-associated constant component EACC1 n=1 Tax=Actinoplanes sp. GCM10030250 TaxID=3273376 RepID=UPI003614C3BE
MEAALKVLHADGDSAAEVRKLLAWLRDEPDLHGARLRLDGVVHEERMGIDVETITAILGPAGAGAALISAVSAFLTTRRNVKIRVEGPQGAIDLDARMSAGDIDRHLRQAGTMTGLVPAPDATS